MTIRELCRKAHEIAVDKEFWLINPNGSVVRRNNAELLMLCVSELGETCEALRHKNPPSEHIPEFSAVEEELADLLIRVGDMCQANEYRLEEAIVAKMEYNKTRPIKHNKEF